MSTRKSSNKHGKHIPAPAAAKSNLQDLLDVRKCLDLLDNRKTEEAKAICTAVLARAPNLVFANHARGLIAMQEGQFAQAEQYLRKAIEADPNNAEYLSNLAGTVLSQDRIDESIAIYERAIAIDKENRAARIGLANALHEKNDPEASIKYFEDAARREPNAPGPLSHLGRALIDARRFDEAVATILKSLEYQINFAPSHTALGEAFHAMEMYKEAVESHKTAILLDPQDTYAHNKIADSYLKINKIEEAHEHLLRVIEIAPKDPNGYVKLGSSYFNTGDRFDDAMRMFKQALALDPKHALTYNNIGAIQHDHGDYDDALGNFRTALALRPNYPTAKHNLALTLLLRGQFEEGWECHESRLTTKERAHVYRLIHKLFEVIPKWDGKSSLAGKRILLMHEQGFGDSIQFLRYARLLMEQGASVALHVKNPLYRLFQSFTPAVTLVRESDPLPPCDCAYVLMSLPYAMRTHSVEDIPRYAEGYLSADASLAAHWKQKISTLTRSADNLRVGIVWGGNPEHGNDRHRSIPLEKVKQLFEIPRMEFYSLQKGKPADGLKELPTDWPVFDLGNECQDFADTAAAISNLDLVICVDTSVAHLAGALGHPTWVLLPHVPDWRWLNDRDDSPWYPGMRLFRQPAVSDWDSVLKKVGEELTLLQHKKAQG
ncbi:tetratricopeptide repeat protein [Herbaspirillum sp.]|jgi:tetratricopeptide (TPR) repeat protein|uniref:tetratricopeptide repeat protein n=1 Tax=Herbaspirillum TaxID=963 RepID=UPI002585A07B|nr:tetratricopeptide repeat protein [Herbaspirillum sp.]MCP3655087.1 tetratricopeptide repeat protein [Herbaspirillum sp.]MCP3945734.1 tetratricopeptide repeat protein [Herbaspirillum sp.]MCP4032050.1 tetratricopeptide repeat protein [Herbaspirillum sp.]MCP4558519.1 tetratricopeptide repeat protein [Herbaspirillum sp.]